MSVGHYHNCNETTKSIQFRPNHHFSFCYLFFLKKNTPPLTISALRNIRVDGNAKLSIGFPASPSSPDHCNSSSNPFDQSLHQRSFKETKLAQMFQDSFGRTHLNEYVILKTIGTSPQAKVKLCQRTGDQRLCAVKIMRRSLLARRKLTASGMSVLSEVMVAYLSFFFF
jgi:hypothetical protein